MASSLVAPMEQFSIAPTRDDHVSCIPLLSFSYTLLNHTDNSLISRVTDPVFSDTTRGINGQTWTPRQEADTPATSAVQSLAYSDVPHLFRCDTLPVRDGHGGGWSRKINAWHLYTLMVYL